MASSYTARAWQRAQRPGQRSIGSLGYLPPKMAQSDSKLGSTAPAVVVRWLHLSLEEVHMPLDIVLQLLPAADGSPSLDGNGPAVGRVAGRVQGLPMASQLRAAGGELHGSVHAM